LTFSGVREPKKQSANTGGRRKSAQKRESELKPLSLSLFCASRPEDLLACSETEAQLRFDASIAGRLIAASTAAAPAAAEASGRRDRLAEQRRAEIAYRRSLVRVIEKVLHVDGERQAVTLGRLARVTESPAALRLT
jgi:hypothetical protein